jgi:uncharacterized protein (DUF2267 family)/pterin-4a-carbinolamine dehydratase
MPIEYEEFIEAVSRSAGIDHQSARKVAQATFVAVAERLDNDGRQRLAAALPPLFRQYLPRQARSRDWDLAALIREMAQRGKQPPEQARVRAQAVLAAIAEREPDLPAGLPLPDDIRELFTPPEIGGGVTGASGHLASLTSEEVDAALRRLPDWEGDTSGLRRTIVLPPDSLDRVLDRIENLRRDLGGGVYTRRDGGNAEVTVKTASVNAVTAPDVDIAASIDRLIADFTAGMSAS